jgi:hypothetical protein
LLHFDRRHSTRLTAELMRRSKCGEGEAPVTSGLAATPEAAPTK